MPVTIQVENNVATLSMDYPKVNAFGVKDTREIAALIGQTAMRDDVHCLILCAPGKFFCVGANVKELNADASLIGYCNQGWYLLFKAVYECPVPVISAVHGYCLGGGIGIAGASDVIFASKEASFGLPEVKVGALGGATYLMRMVGTQRTRACMYTGDPMSAEQVASYGSIHEVTELDELMPKSRALAEQIAANSPDAVRLAKESLNGIEATDINRSYRWEQGFTLELYTSPESAAARTAQVEGGFKK